MRWWLLRMLRLFVRRRLLQRLRRLLLLQRLRRHRLRWLLLLLLLLLLLPLQGELRHGLFPPARDLRSLRL